MKLWCVDREGLQVGNTIVLGSWIERVVSRSRILRQLFRRGIHHLWPLPNGNLFVVALKRAMYVNRHSGEVETVFRLPLGKKPGHRGVCIDDSGAVFVGEYVRNLKRRHPINVYRIPRGARSLESCYTFTRGDVRHVHFVQWDPFAKCLWMGTGDKNSECRMYRSNDSGNAWELIGGGSQQWRAVGLAFRSDAIYWGTDAGSVSNRNYVMRLDRQSCVVEHIIEIQGPCHSIATLSNGTIALSTGIEGGANESDDSAHLWVSKDGVIWQEVASFRKDNLPYNLQFGVIRFPQGLETSTDLLFTTMGLQGAGETSFRCSLT